MQNKVTLKNLIAWVRLMLILNSFWYLQLHIFFFVLWGAGHLFTIYASVTPIGSKLRGLADAAEKYHVVLAENRKLYNEVQDLKGT